MLRRKKNSKKLSVWTSINCRFHFEIILSVNFWSICLFTFKFSLHWQRKSLKLSDYVHQLFELLLFAACKCVSVANCFVKKKNSEEEINWSCCSFSFFSQRNKNEIELFILIFLNSVKRYSKIHKFEHRKNAREKAYFTVQFAVNYVI